MTNTDKSLWTDKCDYIDVDKCDNLNTNNMNLIVLQLNIRSLLAHQTELRNLLCCLEKLNSVIDAVLLSETFLSKKTQTLINIPGYILFCNNREINKGGGTAILLRKDIKHPRRRDLEEFHEGKLESTYLEIYAKNKKKIIIGSLYHPPNRVTELFYEHLSGTIPKVKLEGANTHLILGMDHNLDLLKCNNHTATWKFLDMMLDNNMILTITRPTRITQQSATLIDNVFISEVLQRNFDSAVLIDDMSDHLPSLVLMKQTRLAARELIEFNRRTLNASSR